MSKELHIKSKTDLRIKLEQARKAGGWLPWAATSVAMICWGGAGAYLYGRFGLETILAVPPLELSGLTALAITPGLALILAGFMARESTRSARANAIVLSASRQLLAPLDELAEEFDSLGVNLARTSNNIHDTLNETEARVQIIKQDMEESSNAAMKASEVVRADSEALRSKLMHERDELMRLSQAIRNQSATLAEAIPMHAEKMTRAAELAETQVRKAGKELDERLNNIDSTGRSLAASAANLDQMTAESRKRAQQLVQSLMSINENLLNSSRTVDNALKAGDMAVEASKSTALAIRDAMDSALEGARRSSEEVAKQSALTQEEADRAMARLIEAANRAETLVQAAMNSADAHAEATEQRVDRLSEHMYNAATRATSAAEMGLERARSRIERASRLLNEDIFENEATKADADRAVEPEIPPKAEAESAAQTLDIPVPIIRRPTRLSDLTPFDPLDDEIDAQDDEPQRAKPTATSEPQSAAAAAANAVGQDDMSWKDLLSSIREQANAVAPERSNANPDTISADVEPSNEAPAQATDIQLNGQEAATTAFVSQLDKAGIRLKRAIRSSDLRRIAAATARGDRQRRRATKQAAPGELTQIQRLLNQDEDLRIAAESYLALEKQEALNFLKNAERAREDAEPRIAAYLLLDAALTH